MADDLLSTSFLCFPQALPYVALLIAMLFFIYAVIGMQVKTTFVFKSYITAVFNSECVQGTWIRGYDWVSDSQNVDL